MLLHCSEYIQVIQNYTFKKIFNYGNMNQWHGLKLCKYSGCSNHGKKLLYQNAVSESDGHDAKSTCVTKYLAFSMNMMPRMYQNLKTECLLGFLEEQIHNGQCSFLLVLGTLDFSTADSVAFYFWVILEDTSSIISQYFSQQIKFFQLAERHTQIFVLDKQNTAPMTNTYCHHKSNNFIR